MINPMDLTGKHVLITGGSSGIGRQCAIQASRLGARVTIVARREDKLQETLSMLEGNGHAYFAFDLYDTNGIEGLVKNIVSQHGAVDCFCHAAGIGTVRPIKMTKPFYVEKMFRIHTFAFIEFVRCLSLKKNLNDGASLVGVSSVGAEKGNISQGAYSAAKGAMNSFIKPAAIELAPRKIRVNTVAFGIVRTAMFKEFEVYSGDQKVMDRQYLGVIEVENAADAVMYLFSDTARFITASIFPVYAGY